MNGVFLFSYITFIATFKYETVIEWEGKKPLLRPNLLLIRGFVSSSDESSAAGDQTDVGRRVSMDLSDTLIK